MIYTDREINLLYTAKVREIIDRLGHDLNIGGKYQDAYAARSLPKYGVLRAIDNKIYELTPLYAENAHQIVSWILQRLSDHISERLGIIPQLGNRQFRVSISSDPNAFISLLDTYIDRNAANFEIFSFAVLKVHLEKFACKVYRDSRTSAHDNGVDLSTNFGVVYQIKKLNIYSRNAADDVYSELKLNFDNQRLVEGNVVLIIDDITKDVRQYLLNMRVQSISKREILLLATQFEDVEDREKVLRVIYEEFGRDYRSNIS